MLLYTKGVVWPRKKIQRRVPWIAAFAFLLPASSLPQQRPPARSLECMSGPIVHHKAVGVFQVPLPLSSGAGLVSGRAGTGAKQMTQTSKFSGMADSGTGHFSHMARGLRAPS